MKQYVKMVCKRYLVILFFLSFSSIILTPEFNSFKSGLFIFFYRFNVFSIFSLLFATLSTIQNYEKNNVNTAITMSGMHSFRIIRPVYYFACFVTLLSLCINQFFLGPALDMLGKGVYLSSLKQKHHVHKLDTGLLFYKNNFEHFTFIDNDQNILYAKHAEKNDDGFNLFFADHFIKSHDTYIKTTSVKNRTFSVKVPTFKEPSTYKTSDSITSLLNIYQNPDPNAEIKEDALISTLSYKILMPFLNIFAVSLATIFGFSKTFRRKSNLCFCLAVFTSLLCFFILECTSILSLGSILSPFVFISIASFIITLPPMLAYARKI